LDLQRGDGADFPGLRCQYGEDLPVRDPASGLVLDQHLVYVSLLGYRGEEVAPGLIPPAAARGPSPGTLALCRKERAELEEQITVLRRTTEGMSDPRILFDGAKPNPTLAREFYPEIRSLLGGDTAPTDLTVECRGDVCRVAAPETALRNDLWRLPLRKQPTFDRRVRKERAFLTESYMRVVPSGWVQGRELLNERFAAFDASSARKDCEARHPGTGSVIFRFEVPWSGEMGIHGQAGRIWMAEGGSLNGTPLAQCVAAAVQKLVLAQKLPDGVTHGLLTKRLEFSQAASP
jgi:hypothetical protein